jgi:hypothetical protein
LNEELESHMEKKKKKSVVDIYKAQHTLRLYFKVVLGCIYL